MKKSVMLSISLLIGCLNAMLYCMDGSEITFVKATPDEDLDSHEKILRLFLSQTNPGEEEYVNRSIDTNFPITKRRVRQEEGNYVFNILDQSNLLDPKILVGFMIVEELDEAHLAGHHIALSNGYRHLGTRCLEYIKRRFSNAKTISMICPSKLKQAQEQLKLLGFKQNNSDKCNEELGEAIEEPVVFTFELKRSDALQ